MDLSFFPLTLEAVDSAHAESLCLFVASDERPLTGLAGLADWRLSGKLSRLLRGGVLTGDAGEAVLTPPGTRLGFQKMFLFGLGPLSQPEDALVEQLRAALRKLADAGANIVAMELPSRLSPDTGIRLLVDELHGPGRALVFGADPQRLVQALALAAARGSAPPPERRVVKVQAPVTKPAPPPMRHHAPRAQPPPQAMPKASPPPFAPPPDAPPAWVTPPPAPALPKASPLPFAPPPGGAGFAGDGRRPKAGALESEPPIAPPAFEPPVAMPVSEPPPAPTAADLPKPPEPVTRPAPPPSQKYVPPPAKEDHVFSSKKKRRH